MVVHDEGALGGEAAALLHAPQAHVLFLHVRLQGIRAGLGGGQFNRKTIGSTFGPVDSCGQVRYLDPSLVNSRNLSQIGQVGPVDSCGQVGDLYLSLVNSRNISWVGQVRPVDSCGQVRNIDPSGSK